MVKLQVRHSIAGTVDYFVKDSALTEEERHGIWLGRGVELSGFQTGPSIRPKDLECFLHGYSPSGERLFARQKANRRCAWDCVVTTEKSVSVAALCSSECRSVKEAFRIAVIRLLYHLESLAYRQDNAGTGIAQPTGNLIAAKYVHEASRHADPHVHAHLLLMNATFGTLGNNCDRCWRSLEPANIYRNQRALRWVFNAELHRQLYALGLRSSVDTQGITRLPVPKDICLKYSRAHAAIANMAADMLREGNIPPEWEKLHPPELINRINDRSRPAKRLPRTDWQQLLNAETKRHLSTLLVDHKARPIPFEYPPASPAKEDSLPVIPPPPPWFWEDPEFHVEQARELLGKELKRTALYFSPQTIKLTTCRVAAAHLDLPLGAFARAAHWWSENRPEIKVFSRTAAAKLESISRRLLHSRLDQSHHQSLAAPVIKSL
jgi:conjugative relaxase-like TrwC/TraI family protein